MLADVSGLDRGKQACNGPPGKTGEETLSRANFQKNMTGMIV